LKSHGHLQRHLTDTLYLFQFDLAMPSVGFWLQAHGFNIKSSIMLAHFIGQNTAKLNDFLRVPTGLQL
jgi:hypothetical protein